MDVQGWWRLGLEPRPGPGVRLVQVRGVQVFKQPVQFLSGQEQFARIEYRTFHVVTALFPALVRSALLVANRVRATVLQHQARRLEKVIQQAGCFVVEQGQVLLEALWMHASAQVLV